MSRADGVFRIDPSTGTMPVRYYVTRHYYVRGVLERVLIKSKHLIDKGSLIIKELEHVLIEKVEQLFLEMLSVRKIFSLSRVNPEIVSCEAKSVFKLAKHLFALIGAGRLAIPSTSLRTSARDISDKCLPFHFGKISFAMTREVSANVLAPVRGFAYRK